MYSILVEYLIMHRIRPPKSHLVDCNAALMMDKSHTAYKSGRTGIMYYEKLYCTAQDVHCSVQDVVQDVDNEFCAGQP